MAVQNNFVGAHPRGTGGVPFQGKFRNVGALMGVLVGFG